MRHRCHLMHGQNLSGASPEHGQSLSRAWPEPQTGLKSVGDASLTLDVDECLRKSDQIAFFGPHPWPLRSWHRSLIHGLSVMHEARNLFCSTTPQNASLHASHLTSSFDASKLFVNYLTSKFFVNYLTSNLFVNYIIPVKSELLESKILIARPRPKVAQSSPKYPQSSPKVAST